MPSKKYTAPIGDNSNGMIRSYVDKFENLLQRQQDTADDISEVSLQAKAAGFDVKTLKAVAKMRLKDKEKQTAEEIQLLHTYAAAVGIQLELSFSEAA